MYGGASSGLGFLQKNKIKSGAQLTNHRAPGSLQLIAAEMQTENYGGGGASSGQTNTKSAVRAKTTLH